MNLKNIVRFCLSKVPCYMISTFDYDVVR